MNLGGGKNYNRQKNRTDTEVSVNKQLFEIVLG